MTLASTQIRKPTDWQAFERALKSIAKHYFKDPEAQLNGRNGQAQNGVDVFGYRDKNLDQLFGIQAKKSDDPITTIELNNEVIKAKKFQPPLKEFYLLTTAPRDAKIQTQARLINEKNQKDGINLKVIVWFWDDIEELANENALISRAFDPTYNPYADQQGKKVLQKLDETNDILSQVLANQVGGFANVPTQNTSINLTEHEDLEAFDHTPLHGKIDAWIELTNGRQAFVAKQQIELTIEQDWNKASKSEKYRLTAALAGALLKLGDFEGAAGKLGELQSYNIFPEKTAINLTTAELLKGNFEKAIDCARLAIKDYPDQEQLYGILAQALANKNTTLNPLDEIPEKYKSLPEVKIASIVWLRSKENPKWIEEAFDFVDANPSMALANAFCADAKIEAIIGTQNGYVGGAKPQELKHSDMCEAAKTLDKYVAQAIDSQEFVDLSFVHNGLLALRMADQDKLALQRYKELPIDIKNRPSIILQAALAALQCSTCEEALLIIGDSPESIELKLLAIEILHVEKKYEKALKAFDELSRDDIPNERIRIFDSIHARIIAASKSVDEAITFLQEKAKNNANDIHLKALIVDLLLHHLRDDEANQHIDDIISSTPENLNFIDRLELARLCYVLNRYFDAIFLLEHSTDLSRMSEALRILLRACINGGYSKKASNILSQLSDELTKDPFILRCNAVLAINVGDENALNKLEAYIDDRPYDAEMLYSYISRLAIEQGIGAAIEFVKCIDFDQLKGRAEQLMGIAQLSLRYERIDDALNFGYQILVSNWSNPSLHLLYSGLIFGVRNTDKLIPNPNKVENNCVVELQDDKGKIFDLLIANDNPSTFVENWEMPTENLASHAIGTAVSEKFSVKVINKLKTYTVKSIKHKWIHALHKSLSVFEARFPLSDGMRSIRFDPNSDDPIIEIREQLKAKTESNNRLIEIYNAGSIPFCMIAEKISNDVISVFSGFAGEGNKFISSSGTEIERRHELSSVSQNRGLGAVIDPLTVYFIKQLNILGIVQDVLGTLYITESTRNIFNDRFTEAEKFAENGYFSLAWRNGQIERTSLDDRQLAELLDSRRDEVQWVNDNFNIATAIPKEEPSEEIRDTFEILPRAFVHSALAASGKNIALVSEDFNFRQWAITALNLNCCSLQSILLTAFHEGLIDIAAFSEANRVMIISGFQYVSLCADVLKYIAQQDAFELTDGLKRMLWMIGGPSADLSTNPSIVADFLDTVTQKSGNNTNSMAIMSETFRSMCSGRMQHKKIIVDEILKQKKHQSSWIFEHAEKWIYGHSIGET